MIAGPFLLGGTLEIALQNRFVPAVGQKFVIMQATNGIFGTFASIEGQTFNNGRSLYANRGRSDCVARAKCRPGAIAVSAGGAWIGGRDA